MSKSYLHLRLAATMVCIAWSGYAADWKPAENTLTTPWTAQVRADKVLPGYPRPQLVRSAWTNLNGLWDYAITPKDSAGLGTFQGSILVPYPVESALSGVKRRLTPEERLWYRRSFKLPDLKGQRLLLHFGAMDWRAEVFVTPAQGTLPKQ